MREIIKINIDHKENHNKIEEKYESTQTLSEHIEIIIKDYYGINCIYQEKNLNGLNNNYLIKDDKLGEFIIRIFSKHSIAKNIEEKHGYINSLFKKNFPVAKIILNKEGDSFTKYKGTYCALYKKIEGRHLSEKEFRDKLPETAIQVARMHENLGGIKLKQNWHHTEASSYFKDSIYNFNPKYTEYLKYSLLPRKNVLIATVHSDLKPFNTIYNENENKLYFIDWENAKQGSIEYELGQLCGKGSHEYTKDFNENQVIKACKAYLNEIDINLRDFFDMKFFWREIFFGFLRSSCWCGITGINNPKEQERAESNYYIAMQIIDKCEFTELENINANILKN